ncbi:MAG: hypothetical protein ACREOO_31900 [bacterium]
MDRRSQASLTHRIVTEVLGLTLVAGALAIGTISNLTASQLGEGLAIYAVFFTFNVLVWWQMGGMAAVGIFRNRTNNLLGMLVAFAIALLPVFLRLLLSDASELQQFSTNALPVSFAIVGIAIALMIRTGNVYQSKRQWRLVHHALWAASFLYIASIFIPFSTRVFSTIPLRELAWFMILMVPLVARRMGVSLVATPAKPPSPRPLPTENSHANSHEAGRNLQGASANNSETGREESQDRRQRRGHGHYRHRRQGGSRRRV